MARLNSSWLTLSLLAVSLGLAPGHVSAAQSGCDVQAEDRPPVAAEPVELCELTTVRAERPSGLRVRLQSEVTIRNPLVAEGSDFSLEGEGDFVGFVLVQDPPTPGQPAYLGGRLPASGESRLFFLRLGCCFADSAGAESQRIRPGDYLLFLLPGEDSLELNLRLSGLTGWVETSTRRQVAYQLEFPDPRLPPAAENLYAAGGVGTISRQDLLFQAAWLVADTHAVTQADACVYEGEPPSPWASLPGCVELLILGLGPGNQVQGQGSGHHGPEDKFRLYYGNFDPNDGYVNGPSRTWGQNISIATVSTIDSIDSLALWLSYQ